jgi:hypothetical protein
MSLLISFCPSCNDIFNFIANFCSPSNDFTFVLNLIDFIVSRHYKTLPLSTNFRIVDGGSTMEKYMLDGLGFR